MHLLRVGALFLVLVECAACASVGKGVVAGLEGLGEMRQASHGGRATPYDESRSVSVSGSELERVLNRDCYVTTDLYCSSATVKLERDMYDPYGSMQCEAKVSGWQLKSAIESNCSSVNGNILCGSARVTAESVSCN